MRKDIKESYKCVTQNWMKNDYNDSVIEWFPLKNGNIMVKTKYKKVLTIKAYRKNLILSDVT